MADEDQMTKDEGLSCKQRDARLKMQGAWFPVLACPP